MKTATAAYDELARRARDGDDHAAAQLYTSLRIAGVDFVRRLLFSADHELLFGECFDKALSTYDSTKGGFRSWLLTLVRNRVRDELRKGQIREREIGTITRLAETRAEREACRRRAKELAEEAYWSLQGRIDEERLNWFFEVHLTVKNWDDVVTESGGRWKDAHSARVAVHAAVARAKVGNRAFEDLQADWGGL